MKIMFWLPDGFWDKAVGGVESLAKTLATELQKKGHQIYVISFESHFNPKNSREIIEGIELIRIGNIQNAKKEQLQTLKTLYLFLNQIKPDLFHLHYTANSNLIYYLLLAKYIKCPQLMTTHGLLCEEHFPIYKQIAAKMKKIFCVSKYLSDVSLSITKTKSFTIYNGIDCQHIAFSEPKNLQSIRFVCLGRLTQEKGYDLAIEAFNQISPQFPHISLDIIGGGIEKEHLLQITRKNPKIHFLGAFKHQEAIKALAKYHIVLIPSRYESFGMVAIEAGLIGRPVIASQVGGLIEIINPETGILVPPNNVEQLANAMKSLIEEPFKIEILGKNAHDRIKNYFSSEKMFHQYLSHYQQIWRQTHATHRQLLAQRRTTPALESSTS